MSVVCVPPYLPLECSAPTPYVVTPSAASAAPGSANSATRRPIFERAIRFLPVSRNCHQFRPLRSTRLGSWLGALPRGPTRIRAQGPGAMETDRAGAESDPGVRLLVEAAAEPPADLAPLLHVGFDERGACLAVSELSALGRKRTVTNGFA